jgi:hypothetical protein
MVALGGCVGLSRRLDVDDEGACLEKLLLQIQERDWAEIRWLVTSLLHTISDEQGGTRCCDDVRSDASEDRGAAGGRKS